MQGSPPIAESGTVPAALPVGTQLSAIWDAWKEARIEQVTFEAQAKHYQSLSDRADESARTAGRRAKDMEASKA